jgi:hypothetical protein
MRGPAGKLLGSFDLDLEVDNFDPAEVPADRSELAEIVAGIGILAAVEEVEGSSDRWPQT